MKNAKTLLVALLTSTVALAGPPQWTWDAGKQSNNGAITIKSMNGGTTYAGTQNPTGAVVKMNQTASTQPPTVIVQATASLPIHAVGDPCTANTSGTSPNQTADEGAAITADRQSLLSCQSGAWQKSGSGVASVMYLLTHYVSGYTYAPANCPIGWTELDYQMVSEGNNANMQRTCMSTAPHAITYLLTHYVPGYSYTPANCPVGWTQADYQLVNSAETGGNQRRTCFL